MRPELDALADKLAMQWCESLTFSATRQGALAISTPFLFRDGDVLPVFVTYSSDDGWKISDQGQTQQRAFPSNSKLVPPETARYLLKKHITMSGR